MRCRSRRFAICLLALNVLGCTSEVSHDEDYRVYEAFLRQRPPPVWTDDGRLLRFVISTNTDVQWILGRDGRPPLTVQSLREGLPGLETSAADSFLERNRQEHRLALERFRLDAVELLHPDEFRLFFANREDTRAGWAAFYERFPGSPGYIWVSRPGFSSDGRQAVLYIGCQAADLVGGGGVALMVRHGDNWEIKETLNLWIS